MFFYWVTCEYPKGNLLYRPDAGYKILKARHLRGTVYEYVMLSRGLAVFYVLLLVVLLASLYLAYSTSVMGDPGRMEFFNELFFSMGLISLTIFVVVPLICYYLTYRKWQPIIEVEMRPQGIIEGDASNYKASFRHLPDHVGYPKMLGFGITSKMAVNALLINANIQLNYSLEEDDYMILTV